MKTLLNRFMMDESGATAIEYGLIAALVAVACIATWSTLGTNLDTKFAKVKDCLNSAASC